MAVLRVLRRVLGACATRVKAVASTLLESIVTKVFGGVPEETQEITDTGCCHAQSVDVSVDCVMDVANSTLSTEVATSVLTLGTIDGSESEDTVEKSVVLSVPVSPVERPVVSTAAEPALVRSAGRTTEVCRVSSRRRRGRRTDQDHPYVTRSGRTVKPRVILDL